MSAFLATIAVGAALGLRFKAFVLVPAIATSSIGGLTVGIGRGDSVWSSLLATLSVITALQIGHVAGTIVNFGAQKGSDPVNVSLALSVAQMRQPNLNSV